MLSIHLGTTEPFFVLFLFSFLFATGFERICFVDMISNMRRFFVALNNTIVHTQ